MKIGTPLIYIIIEKIMNFEERLIRILLEGRKPAQVKKVTSKDGHHHFFGTRHKDSKDGKGQRREKRRHVRAVKNHVTRAMDRAHAAGKEIHFHTEGMGGGVEGTHEREIHNYAMAHAKKHGMTMHSRSAEPDNLPHKGVMKDDSKRSHAEMRKAFPRDHGGKPTKESKKIDANNRYRQKHWGNNAKIAHKKGHASIHIGGEGHVGRDTASGHEEHGTHGVKL